MADLIKLSDLQNKAVDSAVAEGLAKGADAGKVNDANRDMVRKMIHTMLTGTNEEGMMDAKNKDAIDRVTQRYVQALQQQSPSAGSPDQPAHGNDGPGKAPDVHTVKPIPTPPVDTKPGVAPRL